MLDLFSESSISKFFDSIYRILRKFNPELTEVWCEPLEIDFFREFDQKEIKKFASYFAFLTLKKGNYMYYIVIDKLLFIIQSLKYLQLDISFLSTLLDYKGFEALVKLILNESNYYTLKNYRFSDKSNFQSKTKQSNYEIDVVGIDQKMLLIIDCKQWKRKDSYGAMNKAANLQLRRALALKKNPEIFSEMLRELVGINKLQNLKPPFLLVPLMVTLENNWININEKSIPIVSIHRFNSFLQELDDNLSHFKVVKINKIPVQKQLS
ncbi:MAG: hypothetical protein EU517_01165 [Promethearchaeota archaeon]|nr:MAG: hypothetical protein EU517_01165 [Candidatus Lokiarchaeota archaeon]